MEEKLTTTSTSKSNNSTLDNLSQTLLQSVQSKITNMSLLSLSTSSASTSSTTTTTTNTTTNPKIIPLTKSGSTWIMHISNFFPPPNPQIFEEMFQRHPEDFQSMFLHGKYLSENRYSQLYVTDPALGTMHEYSGTAKKSILCNPHHTSSTSSATTGRRRSSTNTNTNSNDIGCNDDDKRGKPDEQFIATLCDVVANHILDTLENMNLVHRTGNTTPTTTTTNNNNDNYRSMEDCQQEPSSLTLSPATPTQRYNSCLTNWYHPEHSIGWHSDVELRIDPEIPIMSLSWGGPRRFLLRAKPDTLSSGDALEKCFEFIVKSGDLLIMGGKCQDEFKHSIPKARQKDGCVQDRISWTIRGMMRPPEQQEQEEHNKLEEEQEQKVLYEG